MLDLALRAIAEPRRREVLGIIHETEMAAGDIASHFDITRPAVSQHLKVLVDAGLITARREGTRILYQARPEGLEEIRDYLERFWGDSLRSLKRVAEAEERRSSEDDIRHRRGGRKGDPNRGKP